MVHFVFKKDLLMLFVILTEEKIYESESWFS